MDAWVLVALLSPALLAVSSASWLPEAERELRELRELDLQRERERDPPWPGRGPVRDVPATATGPASNPVTKVHIVTHGQSGHWSPHKQPRKRPHGPVAGTGAVVGAGAGAGGLLRGHDQSFAAQSYPPLDRYRISDSLPYGLLPSSTPSPSHRYFLGDHLGSSTARPPPVSSGLMQSAGHHNKHQSLPQQQKKGKEISPDQQGAGKQQPEEATTRSPGPSTTTTTPSSTTTTEKPGPDTGDIHRQLQKQLSQQIQMQLEQLQRLHELQHKMLEVPKLTEATTASVYHERSTETIKRSVTSQQPNALPSQQSEQLVAPPRGPQPPTPQQTPEQHPEQPPEQQHRQEQRQHEPGPYVNNYLPGPPLFGPVAPSGPFLNVDPSPPPLPPPSPDRPRYPEETEPLQSFVSSSRSTADSGFFPVARNPQPPSNDLSKELFGGEDTQDAESFQPFVENATDPALPYFLLPPAPGRDSEYHVVPRDREPTTAEAYPADTYPPLSNGNRPFAEAAADAGSARPYTHSVFSATGPSEPGASASDNYNIPVPDVPLPLQRSMRSKKRLRPPR